MIQAQTITEGNIRAEKCTNDFGGPNMWQFKVKTLNGGYDDVQWMNVYRIQQFFKTKLPVYQEVDREVNYKLVK